MKRSVWARQGHNHTLESQLPGKLGTHCVTATAEKQPLADCRYPHKNKVCVVIMSQSIAIT